MSSSRDFVSEADEARAATLANAFLCAAERDRPAAALVDHLLASGAINANEAARAVCRASHRDGEVLVELGDGMFYAVFAG